MFNFHHHNLKMSQGIYNLSSKDDIYSGKFSAGLHPYYIDESWQRQFSDLETLFKYPDCVAIGETGLDARPEISTKLQTEVFLKHVEAANSLRKPLIIHCVKRFQEIIQLKKFGETAWVIHGFNKNLETANKLISNGFHLSFGKALLHSVSLQQIFTEIPSDRFFLETDDAEVSIEKIYQKASELKKMTVQDMEAQIMNNISKITDGALA